LDGNGLRVIARLVEYCSANQYSDFQTGDWWHYAPNADSWKRRGFQPGNHGSGVADLHAQEPALRKLPAAFQMPGFPAGETGGFIQSKAPQNAYPALCGRCCGDPRGKQVLIDKRKADGLLGGLWEFPGWKS
jgi:adenine-specific DNA glycosylase